MMATPPIGGTLAATCGYTCKTCGAQVISSVPTERCGPFGCENLAALYADTETASSPR